MGGVNLVAGASFLALGRGVQGAPAAAEPAEAPEVTGFSLYALVALLLGFAMMTIQTILIRVGGLAFGASHFTFSTVVAVYVLCIAIGSLGVSALREVRPVYLVATTWVLTLLFALLYLFIEDAPYWAHVLRVQFGEGDFYAFYLSAFACILLVIGLPVALSGASLPLLFHHLRREVGDLGLVAGRLYSLNTLGNLLGALFGGYVLLFWLDLDDAYRLSVAATAVAATLLTARVYSPPRLAMGVLVVVPVAAALLLAPGWSQLRLSAGAFRVRHEEATTYRGPDAFFGTMERRVSVPFYEDGPTTSVAVRDSQWPDGLARAIVVNGKPDSVVGSVGVDYPTMALAGLVPCLIADRCERAFVIGQGTGVTGGELAALESIDEVVVSEIARGVIEAAPLFDFGNLEASKRPEIELRRGDAYRALLRSDGRFDAIVSEPSNPWVAGVEMLYSREFLEAARGRLAPGGVYAQWFHIYETDRETVELILRTYAAVFENVSVWFTTGPDFLLIGTESSNYDLECMERRFEQPDFRAGFARSGIETFPRLLAHELLPVGVVHAAGLEGDVHTLGHPVLGHRAARAFYTGLRGDLPRALRPEASRAGARNALLERHRLSQGDYAAETYADVARELCESREMECAAWVARWLERHPDSEEALEFVSAQRKRSRGTPHFSVDRLRALRELAGDGAELPESISLGRALRYTRWFELYYSHAAPFEREVLTELWRKCRDPRCADEQRQVELRLGALSDGGP